MNPPSAAQPISGMCKFCGQLIESLPLSQVKLPPDATPAQYRTAAYGGAVGQHLMQHHQKQIQAITNAAQARFTALIFILTTEYQNAVELDAEVAEAKQFIADTLKGPAGPGRLVEPRTPPSPLIV